MDEFVPPSEQSPLPTAQKTGLGWASLVLALLALPAVIDDATWAIGFVQALAAVGLGFVAGARNGATVPAWAGIIVGLVVIVIVLVLQSLSSAIEF